MRNWASGAVANQVHENGQERIHSSAGAMALLVWVETCWHVLGDWPRPNETRTWEKEQMVFRPRQEPFRRDAEVRHWVWEEVSFPS
jgi:hypothetical protein